jgi:hypothetical protein
VVGAAIRRGNGGAAGAASKRQGQRGQDCQRKRGGRGGDTAGPEEGVGHVALTQTLICVQPGFFGSIEQTTSNLLYVTGRFMQLFDFLILEKTNIMLLLCCFVKFSFTT